MMTFTEADGLKAQYGPGVRRQVRAKTSEDRMPPESEASLLAKVTQAARLYGWMVYHTWRSDHSEAGWPDAVLVKGPRALFRELKTDRSKVTPAQQACGDALLAAGCDWDVWRPRDWDEIERTLKGPS